MKNMSRRISNLERGVAGPSPESPKGHGFADLGKLMADPEAKAAIFAYERYLDELALTEPNFVNALIRNPRQRELFDVIIEHSNRLNARRWMESSRDRVLDPQAVMAKAEAQWAKRRAEVAERFRRRVPLNLGA